MAKKPTPPRRPAPARPSATPDHSAAAAATAPRREPAKKGSSTPPPPSTRDAAKIWQERLITADRRYTEWSTEYDCPRLDKYYKGKHWHGLAETDAEKKYVINLVFATIETQLPSLLFSQPKVKVEARPSHEQTANSDAANRATLIEQALQTQIENPRLHFGFTTTLALRDAYARFALAEVGYTADFIDNPNAGKPVLNEKDAVLKGEDGEEVRQPARILKPGTKESLYVKRIPPQSFRASPGRNLLHANDWVAYYEWHYVEDIKRNTAYAHTADLQATGTVSTTVDDPTASDPDRARHEGQVKIWKIWDLRQKVRHVYAEGHPQLLQEGKPYTELPLADLKFYELPDAYYPLPPIYNWISPQDEINEKREMDKIHRRRAVRRYMREPGVKPEEFEKLETGEDMVCIEVPKVNPSPIMPIPDAPLDGSNFQRDAAAHLDFNEITGVGGEARGTPDAPTATQANIVNVRAQMRESRARRQVADWLGAIARLMLLTIREQMQLPFMVKQTMDPFAAPTDPATVARTAQGWREVKAEDVDELDVDVRIDVASLSPVAEDMQRAQWNVVLQLLTNPALVMILMTGNPAAPTEPSPLLRKTLTLNGITSDQEIREIWRVGQIVLQQMQMMQLASMVGGKGGPGGGGGMSLPATPGTHTGMPAGLPAMGA